MLILKILFSLILAALVVPPAYLFICSRILLRIIAVQAGILVCINKKFRRDNGYGKNAKASLDLFKTEYRDTLNQDCSMGMIAIMPLYLIFFSCMLAGVSIYEFLKLIFKLILTSFLTFFLTFFEIWKDFLKYSANVK